MKLLNSKLAKWFFNKKYGIPKDVEIFKLQKTSIHYWKDKARGIKICREFGRNLIDIPDWLKHTFHLWDKYVAKYLPFLDLGYSTDTASTNNKDTYIRKDQSTVNYGSLTYFIVNGSGTLTQRPIIHFTLSSGSGTISAIKLYLYSVAGEENDPTVGVYQLTQTGWIERNDGGRENGASWNEYKSGSNWATPGGDFNATEIHNILVNAGGWFNWDLIETGANGTGLSLTWGDQLHLLLQATNGNEARFWSREYTGDTGLRPYLEITYTAAPTTNIKKVSGVAYASIKKVSGDAIASVKKVAGVA